MILSSELFHASLPMLASHIAHANSTPLLSAYARWISFYANAYLLLS